MSKKTLTSSGARSRLPGEVRSDETSVFPRQLDAAYPNVERGEGVWLHRTDGRRILDACGGGAMVTSLGHGRRDVVEAAAAQAERLPYVYYHHFTNELQERYARRLLDVAAPGMARVRFVSGGSEANEMALRLARQYHVERGDEQRWRVVAPAQGYHGATFGTLALSGRRTVRHPYEPYLVEHVHVPPVASRSDDGGEEALAALDSALEAAGPETIAAFFCEPVSAAARPAYSPSSRFWQGLAERQERYGFLVCFDEIVTGMGRLGTWLAAHAVDFEPDIVSLGKGLGAGYAPLAGILCREHVYDALDAGSRNFEHGHTWDGAPQFCAVGLAVLDALESERLVERVADRGPRLRDELAAALEGCDVVREVRGRGFLLGVEFVDPRDRESLLPAELEVAARVDATALAHDLLVVTSHSSADGYVGDQVLLAPAFMATDDELAEMVERLAAVLSAVERDVKDALASPGAARA
ncbi:MAG TPA: aminotransferase class III-fold pyridoxal phosphate-dependent enzyme [Gaiellaceae bacterium]|nr:aminotransferase class III-fold pyridoxal phosphate-dependent enzyme [Gaiellaceae bacterium]